LALADQEDFEFIKFLFKQGLTEDGKIFGEDPSHYAYYCTTQDGDCILMYFEYIIKEFNIKTIDIYLDDGRECLLNQLGSQEMLNYLIDNKLIDFNERDPLEGSTILHFVATKGATEIVQKLIDVKVDLNAKTRKGKTALDLVMLFNEDSDSEVELDNVQGVAKLLIDAGAD